MPFEGVGFDGRAETPPVRGRLAVPATVGPGGTARRTMPRTERWYEAFELGERSVSPGKAMIEPEMVSYALRYDLPPFHIDGVAVVHGNKTICRRDVLRLTGCGRIAVAASGRTWRYRPVVHHRGGKAGRATEAGRGGSFRSAGASSTRAILPPLCLATAGSGSYLLQARGG